MAKVIGKDQLCSTEFKYFKAIQGIGGKTLFQRYQSLENIVKNNIAITYQDFISHPVQDGEIITFYGIKYNQTPQLLSELQGDEQTKYQEIKEQTLAHYNSTIENLRNSDKAVDAEFLYEATKFIDNRFVYCYDNRVVLGVWGMQMRENVRESIGIAVKNLIVKKAAPIPEPSNQIVEEPKINPIENYNVSFNAGDNGVLNGNSELQKQAGGYVYDNEIPTVEPKEGYEFTGWDKSPDSNPINENTVFAAQYREIPPIIPPPLPWYVRFWNWLKSLFLGRGCLKWLLWLLLILLLLLLFSWLFKDCSCRGLGSGFGAVPAIGVNDSTWMRDDPNAGKGGIYNPGDPYKAKPTDPGYKDILPPQQGVMPPVDTTNVVRQPGSPAIIGNRLNILMENEDKSIMQFAKDFKAKYPDEKYKIVYYDDVVKRLQIELPTEEREQLKQEIPGKFSPDYNLFVFDESLFEGNFAPNDPVFKDADKSWYYNIIKAPQAWDITRGSQQVVVAIVDNGFNIKHPELKDKVVMPYNVWTHSKDVFAQSVDHGTHVAGTALASMNNGEGIAGIAPECKFMPIQIADASGVMTTTSVLDGILYALYQGADVINCSLGTDFGGLNSLPEAAQQELIQSRFKEEERLWNEIMRIADKHKSTIVVAAGNDNILAGIEPLQRPKNIITVSAVDKNNQQFTKSKFSNYGSYSTISAPGVGIYSSVGKNDYSKMDGTSMAAPIVTGGIALMKSINSALTNEQIICVLQSTGVTANGNIGSLIQLDKALQKVKSGNFTDCNSRPETPSTGDVQVLLSWNNFNDLDLVCTDPTGYSIWFKNKKVPSGGQLEIDMNVEKNDSKSPIENIFWPTGGAPNGSYNVYLVYYKKHETNIDETPYKIMVKYGGKQEEFKGNIKKADNTIHICSFTLGAANNAQNSNNSNNVNDKKNNLLKEKERLQGELDRVERELQDIGNERNFRK